MKSFLSKIAGNVSLHSGTIFQRVDEVTQRAIERGHAWLGVDIIDPRTTRLYPMSEFVINCTSVRPYLTGNPLHFALIMATALAIGAGTAGRRSNLRIYILALVAAFLLFCLVLKWQPWHRRLHLPLFVL